MECLTYQDYVFSFLFFFFLDYVFLIQVVGSCTITVIHV